MLDKSGFNSLKTNYGFNFQGFNIPFLHGVYTHIIDCMHVNISMVTIIHLLNSVFLFCTQDFVFVGGQWTLLPKSKQRVNKLVSKTEKCMVPCSVILITSAIQHTATLYLLRLNSAAVLT